MGDYQRAEYRNGSYSMTTTSPTIDFIISRLRVYEEQERLLNLTCFYGDQDKVQDEQDLVDCKSSACIMGHMAVDPVVQDKYSPPKNKAPSCLASSLADSVEDSLLDEECVSDGIYDSFFCLVWADNPYTNLVNLGINVDQWPKHLQDDHGDPVMPPLNLTQVIKLLTCLPDVDKFTSLLLEYANNSEEANK